jgi:hypothetical protein
MKEILSRIALTLAIASCGSPPNRPPPPPGGEQGGSGGDGGSGGSGGGGGGAGGNVQRDSAAGGSGGQGGGSLPDAAVEVARDTGGGSEVAGDVTIPPSAPGQGPTSPGKIVYSQDFEQGMDGITRSPGGLPADRARIEDDPLGQRGKVMRIEWRSGDNFRTSAGTEPRSWISNRAGYEFRPGTNVSHSFGFMMSSRDTDYGFAQIISSGGPIWILTITGQGTLGMLCSCGNSQHMTIEPNRWYDFRIDTDFSGGGRVAFFVNGQMFKQGSISDTRGDIAHWDGGIYNRASGTQANKTRVVYISNLSVGVR